MVALGASGLRSALHDLIDDHRVISYDNCWGALSVLDQYNSTHVRMVYSDVPHEISNRGTSAGWNREHSWPKSYGVGYDGADFSD